MIETRGLRRVYRTKKRRLFANHLGQNVVGEGAIVVAALTVPGLAWSTRLFARSLR